MGYSSSSFETNFAIRSLLKLTAILCLLGVFIPIENGFAQAEDSTQVGTYGSPGAEDEPDEPGFFRRIGFYIDANAGYNYRTNFFTTTQPLLADQKPLNYSSLDLGVFEFSGSVGVLDMPFFEYEYQSPLPRSSFQEEAFEFREDQSHGLEKYTLGIDLTPIWRLILPDRTPKWLVALPSFKIRYWQELTQNSASVERNSFYLPAVNNFPEDPEMSDIVFSDVTEGETFSFRTAYRFGSITWPLVSRFDTDKLYFGTVRFGAAVWEYSRLYSTQYPQLEKPLLYDATTTSLALTLNAEWAMKQGFHYKLNFSYGIGDIDSDTQKGALNVLRGSNEVGGYNVPGYQWEVMFAYDWKLFPENSGLNISIKPGIDFDGFYTEFDKYKKDSGSNTNNDENEEDSDKYHQRDVLVMPWVKVSLNFL